MSLSIDRPGSVRVTITEIDVEQEYLAVLYARVDALREQAATRLAAVRRAGEDYAAIATWQAEVTRLDGVEQGLCFGRLDLRDGHRVYVGRLGLFRDTDDEPLMVDWRAPVAQPFYAATATEPHGVRRRRRIITRGRRVVGLDDELLDPDHAADGSLVGDGALLAAVTADRTGRMRDIVTTLQAEQDRIIRSEHQGVLVVQGGPGTGKTAVALHRVAYLLYTHLHLRARGVLVVGPSRLFLDYIGQVLPGLGENTVVTATIADLCPGIEVSRVDPPKTAGLKGRADMAERLRAAVRARVRIPDEPMDIEFEQQALRLEPETCRRAVRRARQTGLPHNQARLVFAREIVDALAQGLIEDLETVVLTDTGEALDGGSPDGRLSEADLRALAAAGVVIGQDDHDGPRNLLDETDKARLKGSLLADAGVQDVLDDLWPLLTPQHAVSDVVDGPDAGWSVADIPLLDEAAALIGQGGSPATFGHVVVDEAQELSAMAWRMLMRRCPSRSMTVLGDLAQTGNPAGASSWERVLRPHLDDRWRLAQLTVNYRTPAEIMAATADLLAAHHPGLRPPRSVRSTGRPPWRLRTTPAELPKVVADLVATHTEGRLAIVAPGKRLGRLAAELSLATMPDLTDKVVLLAPLQAKGLEFDSVLIIDPAAILDAAPLGHNDLYVAMTRATHRLGIVHPGPPPDELSAIPELTP
ncbi:HelD family protein [Amycolatopsis oliviviridis]|uniref:HelD family protein n=1 Tax=Amycolatopsis oliviviridis TaxID=1471590 RepID=UPI00174EC7DD|nr:UvrD-helicase domain-containing protein [Amycolatopsis oliviviridis]